MKAKPKGKNPDEKKAKSLCFCPRCPTYVKCGAGELAFCLGSVSKSRCIKQEKSCLCPICPVTPLLKLRHSYYCTRGSEKTQLGK